MSFQSEIYGVLIVPLLLKYVRSTFPGSLALIQSSKS